MPGESSSRSLLPLRSDATDLPPAQAGTSYLVPYALLVQCLSSPLATFQAGHSRVQDNLKAFSISNAKLEGTPASHSPQRFAYPGTIPSISSDASSNAIVWALSHDSPPNLYAYNAADLSDELYSSKNTGTRDQFGHTIGHFVTPMIAGGRVYIGTDTGVVVFGLLGE